MERQEGLRAMKVDLRALTWRKKLGGGSLELKGKTRDRKGKDEWKSV